MNTLPHIFVLSSTLKKSNFAIMTGIIQAPHLKPEKRLNKTLFATGLDSAYAKSDATSAVYVGSK